MPYTTEGSTTAQGRPDTGERGQSTGNSGSGRARSETDEAMTRSEEELRVGTRRARPGRARLRKYVVTEQVTKTVPVSHEEVRVEREPITDANRRRGDVGRGYLRGEHEVVLHEEEPVVEKRIVPKERVRLGQGDRHRGARGLRGGPQGADRYRGRPGALSSAVGRRRGRIPADGRTAATDHDSTRSLNEHRNIRLGQSARRRRRAARRPRQRAKRRTKKAQDVAGQAQEKAQEVAGQAQEKGQQAATQAKDKLREQLDQRSSQAAEQVNQQASDLRAVSDSLREQGKDRPASAADRLAEYAEKAGGYLREKDSDALLADAEDLARRQPWAVAAGALALGFAASRFLKASSSKRHSTRRG